jgi:hypothetical protein
MAARWSAHPSELMNHQSETRVGMMGENTGLAGDKTENSEL